jgi:hypothetical protein
MDDNFKAEVFLENLIAGNFDGRVHAEIGMLSYEQLREAAVLMADKLKEKSDRTH